MSDVLSPANPAAHKAWRASLSMNYERQGASTVLRYRHDGPLRIFKSLYPEGPGICHNVVVHPPGGLVEGDQLAVDVRVAEGAHALVSTPGATRFYLSDGTAATQTVRLKLERGARLEWLPLETLAYSGSNGVNTLEMDLAEGAELLAWDVLSLGLPASGQPFERGSFVQRMAWPGTWLEHARMAASDALLLNSPLGLDGQRCLGTLVLACGTPFTRERRELLLELLREQIDAHPLAARCGATCPNDNVLVVRALAQQVEPVMQLWQALWATLREHAWQLGTIQPRVWRV